MPTNFNISLEDASTLTQNYRDQFPPETPFILGEMFDNSSIQRILDQVGCSSLRIYYGLKTDNSQCLILVGVDTDGNDLYEGYLTENGLGSPPYGSTSNPLNS